MLILTIRHVTTYHYKRPVAFGEHRMMLRPRDDERHLSAAKPVLKVALRQEKRRRNEDGAELDGGQDRLPQLRLVVEHEEDPAPALKPLPPEEVRDAV